MDTPSFLTLDKTRHHDLHFFWRQVGDERGEAPRDLGERYAASVEKHKKVLLEELGKKYKEYDSRKEDEALETTSRLYTRLGSFMSEMERLEAAESLLMRALDIDHTLYNNMSRRVAESTTRLASTQHARGKSNDAVQNLYLAFGIYKQLSKPECDDEEAALDAAKTLVQHRVRGWNPHITLTPQWDPC